MATWKQDVVKAMSDLNGKGTLDEIYEKVKNNRSIKLPKTWKAIIRQVIEAHSSDSDNYTNKEDLFYSVEGIGHGVWGLRPQKRR